MIRYLSLAEVVYLHDRVITMSGGIDGIRDIGLLESAVAQPRMSFGGQPLHGDLVEKAAALGFSLIANHAFLDGNKRIGHAAMEVFLLLNGHEIECAVDEQERTIMAVADGRMNRGALRDWLQTHVRAGTK